MAHDAFEVTRLLQEWRSGKQGALDELMPLVYGELHARAASYMRRERPGHTLRTTALVHETFLRLLPTETRWEDRAHFLAVAAVTMRRILTDHARGVQRAKRGSGGARVSLEDIQNEAGMLVQAEPAEMLDLDDALNRLAIQDPRKGRLMEMIYFGGLNCDEAALVLSVSVATVNRDLKLARAWLRQELGHTSPTGA